MRGPSVLSSDTASAAGPSLNSASTRERRCFTSSGGSPAAAIAVRTAPNAASRFGRIVRQEPGDRRQGAFLVMPQKEVLIPHDLLESDEAEPAALGLTLPQLSQGGEDTLIGGLLRTAAIDIEQGAKAGLDQTALLDPRFQLGDALGLRGLAGDVATDTPPRPRQIGAQARHRLHCRRAIEVQEEGLGRLVAHVAIPVERIDDLIGYGLLEREERIIRGDWLPVRADTLRPTRGSTASRDSCRRRARSAPGAGADGAATRRSARSSSRAPAD